MDTHIQKILQSYFILYVKINAKYFINLNTKPITIKILEDNRGEIFDILGKAKRYFRYNTKNTAHKKLMNWTSSKPKPSVLQMVSWTAIKYLQIIYVIKD